MLNLVHPSLSHLVNGFSRAFKNGTVGIEDCIPRCGEGEVILEPPRDQATVDTVTTQSTLSTGSSNGFHHPYLVGISSNNLSEFFNEERDEIWLMNLHCY